MNIEKYKKDIAKLLADGKMLHFAMVCELQPEERKKLEKSHKEIFDRLNKEVGQFSDKYQIWYSEAMECVRQILPLRLNDFISYYKSNAKRKEIDFENYTISDYLQGLRVTYMGEVKVDGQAAVSKFVQQVKIIESLKKKFESSLFDIKQLLQAELFDDELEAAEELAKKGFIRGAGAIAGVVLEGHLATVCEIHEIKVGKKNPCINDYNQALKDADVIEVPTWRKVQHLGDLRNTCDHKKTKEPTHEDVGDLISGVKWAIKNIY